MSRHLFGTDGVRGRAGHFLTAELALKLARAAVTRLEAERPQVLIIRDTRESGEMLESAIAAGVTSAGGDALIGGVLPTPAAPLLVRRHRLDLAAVISASHNPYEDNGIKLFAADGFKLSDDDEHAIEAELEQDRPVPERIGRVRRLHGALEDYLRELHSRFSSLDLSGRRILLDTANGATYRAAPEIMRRLGAEVTVLADDPDGRNINDGCGSTHLQFGDLPAGEPVARQHALDREPDDLLGAPVEHLLQGARLEPAGVAGMAVVALVRELVAGHRDLLGIDDDDEVAGVDVRRVRRLALAAQSVGDLGREPSERLPVGVDDQPVSLTVCRFGYVRFHGMQ